jgi:hypothetical protein
MHRLRASITAGLLLALLPFAIPASASQDNPKKAKAANVAGLHDFDFLVGKWQVHHWRLKERLAGSTEWVEFEGTCHNYPLMEGWGNVDDNVLSMPEGAYRGVGVRSYDGETGQLAIWWIDSRNPHGAVDPPVKGGFLNGVGTFETDDTLRGQKIRVRFTWSKITPTSAHWEQAFSPDGGKTWEVNWRMDFKRVQ